MNQVAETTNEGGRTAGKSNLSRTFSGLRLNRIEQDKQQVEAKWIGPQGAALAHPSRCSRLDYDVAVALKKYSKGHICEVGCGTGRIAGLFIPGRYTGLDINPQSLIIAEGKHPYHQFDLIQWEALYPTADTYLFFTVLMHIPDDEIFGIIRKTDKRVVVGESMGRWLRDYGRGNNYQRDPAEYRAMFSQLGKKEVAFVHASTNHFPFYMDIMVFE